MRSRVVRLLPFLLLPWTWFLVRDLHAAADVVAIGLPVLVAVSIVACLATALIRHRVGALATAGSWALFGLVAIVGPWTPRPGPDPVDPVRIVAANTFGSVPHPPSIGTAIAAQAADVVVVSEVSDGVEEEVGRRFAFDHESEPGRSGRSDVVVFTDLPAEELELPPALGAVRGVRLRVQTPDGPFVLYGLHLPPPRARPGEHPDVSVGEHRRIVRTLRDAVEAETLPVVVAGDLNLVDRTSGYRTLTGVLDDAMRSGWVRHTSRRKATVPLLGRVDHVLVSPTWCSADSTIFALPGSDHRGVAVDIGRCP